MAENDVFDPNTAEDGTYILPKGGTQEIGGSSMSIFSVQTVGGKKVVKKMHIDHGMSGNDYAEIDPTAPTFVTHGHRDHTGALGPDARRWAEEGRARADYYAYGTTAQFVRGELDRAFVTAKQSGVDERLRPKVHDVTPTGAKGIAEFELGGIKLNPFLVSHTWPDALGVRGEGPDGVSFMTYADYRFSDPAKAKKTPDGRLLDASCFTNPGDINAIKRVAGQGVNLLFMDSTSVMGPGYSKTAEEVADGMHKLLNEVEQQRGPRGSTIVSVLGSAERSIETVVEGVKRHNKDAGEDRSKVVALYGYSVVANLGHNIRAHQKDPHNGFQAVAGDLPVVDGAKGGAAVTTKGGSLRPSEMRPENTVAINTGAFAMGNLVSALEALESGQIGNPRMAKKFPKMEEPIDIVIPQRPIPPVVADFNEHILEPVRRLRKEGVNIRMIMPEGSAKALGIKPEELGGNEKLSEGDKWFYERPSIYEGGHAREKSTELALKLVRDSQPKGTETTVVFLHGNDQQRGAGEAIAEGMGMKVFKGGMHGGRIYKLEADGVKDVGAAPSTNTIHVEDGGKPWAPEFQFTKTAGPLDDRTIEERADADKRAARIIGAASSGGRGRAA